MMRVFAVSSFALAVLLGGAPAHANAVWLVPPAPLSTPAARNPVLGFNQQQPQRLFIAYRRRTGGLGVASTTNLMWSDKAVPGSSGADVKGNKNYPAIDVDANDNAHVVWGGPAGLYYATVDANGNPQAAITVSTFAAEFETVRVDAQGMVHIVFFTPASGGGTLYDAQKAAGATGFTLVKLVDHDDTTNSCNPYALGVNCLVGAHSLARTTTGVRLLGEFVLVNRWGYGSGAWTNLSHEGHPNAPSSLGRMQLAFDGTQELDAAVEYNATTNVFDRIQVRGCCVNWTPLSSSVYDPGGAARADDGDPTVALSVNGLGVRAVEWIGADNKIHVSLGTGSFGAEEVLGPAGATTSDMLAGPRGFGVAYADAAGVLYYGAFGEPCGGPCTAPPAGPCWQPTGQCVANKCVYAPSYAACDDGNACTLADHCDAAGACVGGSPKPCNTPPNPQCQNIAGTCVAGACVYPAKVGAACTDDGKPCTRDVCDANGACSHPPAPTGTACNADSSRCTPNDYCSQGQCIADTAHTVSCPALDCRSAAHCNPSTGNCESTPISGGACGVSGCFTSGTCMNGMCSGVPKDCSHNVPVCQVGVCLAGNGQCSLANALNDIPCASADKCLEATHCSGGACVGVKKVCTASGPCRAAACNPASGACEETEADDPACHLDGSPEPRDGGPGAGGSSDGGVGGGAPSGGCEVAGQSGGPGALVWLLLLFYLRRYWLSTRSRPACLAR